MMLLELAGQFLPTLEGPNVMDEHMKSNMEDVLEALQVHTCMC